MLGGALKANAANAPPPSSAKNKSFFTPSNQQSNHDIRAQFNNNRSAVAATAAPARGERGASNTNPSKPLHNISTNTISQTSSTRTFSSTTKGHLMSLYGRNQEDQFGDVPDTSFDAAHIRPTKAVTATAIPDGVELFEDDFDDTFDLDYVEPIALPVAPKTAAPPLPKQPVNKPVGAVSLDSETAIGWSSSPESHFAPPTSRTHSLPESGTSLKRESSGAIPAPKRRTLPASFLQKRSYTQSTDSRPVATPAKPARDPYGLELTASVMQEQKKKHKSKSAQGRDGEDEAARERTAKITRSTMAKNFAITLSAEQKHVLDMVVNHGQSVFFTGPAGTGKSVLMRAIIEELRQKYHNEPDRVAVTASTGFAACNIGGITLHSFSGIGLGKEDASVLVKKVRRNAVAKQRWLKTKCLIIDEVSMVDGDLFDKLSQIGRQIRGNGRPWGGLQLIITGDFFQLPPVPEAGREAKFAFDAATWNTSIDHTIGLTQVFRQRDPAFANMLNEMRLGRIDADTIQAFKKLERPLPTDDGIEATELFSTRHEVESANGKKLMELPGEAHPFAAMDVGRDDYRDRLLQNMMAPKTLVLKVGAQVMLIKNLDENMVNGTQGTVISFVHPNDAVDGDGKDEAAIKARKKIRPFANTDVPQGVKYPLVEFRLANGEKQQILCEPHEWNVELPNGEVQASRKQVPLILAWALSIHKAQGQTLERVRVNLHRIFEKGQAYVALSRATSQEGLQILGFQAAKVMAHPRVIEFYNRLYSVDQVLAKRGSILTSATSKSGGVVAAAAAAATATSSTSSKKPAASEGPLKKIFQSQIQMMPAPDRAAAKASGDKKRVMAHAL